jgi:hypothetical protein
MISIPVQCNTVCSASTSYALLKVIYFVFIQVRLQARKNYERRNLIGVFHDVWAKVRSNLVYYSIKIIQFFGTGTGIYRVTVYCSRHKSGSGVV